MRSSIVFAGLAAVVAADVYTSTVTEDVTITSCAPTVTNCPYKKTSTSADGYEWGEWDTTSTTTAKKSDPTSSSDEDWSEWSDPSKSTTTSKKVIVSVTSSTTDSWVWGDWATTSTTSGKKTSTTTGKKSDPTSSSDEEWDDWESATTSTPAKKTSTTSAVTTGTATTGTATTGTAACPSYTATGPPEWFSLLPTSVLSSIAAKWTGGPPADWCYYTYSTGSLTTSTKPAATVSSSPYWPTGASTTPAAGTGVKGSSTVTGPIGKWTGAANSNAGSMALAGLAAAAAMVLA